MKKIIVSVLTVSIFYIAELFCLYVHADEHQAPSNTPPAVLLVINGVNKILDALSTTADKIDEPMIKVINASVKAALSEEGPFGGFDLDRPWGLIIDPQNVSGVFLPIKDWDIIRKKIEDNGDSIDCISDNLYKVISENDDSTVYLYKDNNWILISPDKNTLSRRISDTTVELIRQKSQESVFSFTFNSASLDKQTIDDGIQGIKTVLTDLIDSLSEEKDEPIAILISQLTENGMNNIIRLIQDKTAINSRLTFDNQNGFTFESEITADSASPSGRFFNNINQTQNNLVGFYNSDAAFSFSLSGKINFLTDHQRELLFTSLKKHLFRHLDSKIPDEKQRLPITEMISPIEAEIVKTLQQENKNCAATLFLKPNEGGTIVIAAYGSNGYELEKKLFQLIEIGCKNGQEQFHVIRNGIKHNAAVVNDVHIHTITFKIPAELKNQQFWEEFLEGDEMVVAVGFGKQLICASSGAKALQTLQTAIEKSSQPQSSPIFEAVIHNGDLFRRTVQYERSQPKPVEKFNRFKKIMGETYNNSCTQTFEISGVKNGIKFKTDISFDAIKYYVKKNKIE